MTRRKLPIGVQTFRTVREDHCYYVDKTAWTSRWRTAATAGVEFSKEARNLAAFDVEQA